MKSMLSADLAMAIGENLDKRLSAILVAFEGIIQVSETTLQHMLCSSPALRSTEASGYGAWAAMLHLQQSEVEIAAASVKQNLGVPCWHCKCSICNIPSPAAFGC